jgi:hypothetical protein
LKKWRNFETEKEWTLSDGHASASSAEMKEQEKGDTEAASISGYQEISKTLMPRPGGPAEDDGRKLYRPDCWCFT